MHLELLDHFSRGEGAESGHSLGTSGPVASHDDGAIFLTAAKNQQRIRATGVPPHLGRVLLITQDMILFQGFGGMNRRKECGCRTRFLDTDSSRGKHDSPARTWSHPHPHRDTPAPTCPQPHVPARAHAWTPEDDHHHFMFGFLKGLLFQLSKF